MLYYMMASLLGIPKNSQSLSETGINPDTLCHPSKSIPVLSGSRKTGGVSPLRQIFLYPVFRLRLVILRQIGPVHGTVALSQLL